VTRSTYRSVTAGSADYAGEDLACMGVAALSGQRLWCGRVLCGEGLTREDDLCCCHCGCEG
jgi:hypothetical protein